MKEKRIGLLGGTFDPIHIGHLNLAFELAEKRQLDEVWFIPAHINPLKTRLTSASIEHRMAMVQAAIQDIPQFHLKDTEARRPPPSYTIDTIRILLAQEAGNPIPHQFFLLMGEDALAGFLEWRMPEEIVSLASLLIGSRTGSWSVKGGKSSDSIREAIQIGMTPTRLMDISATDIRSRLANHLYCSHLIPSSVMQYIHEKELYSSIL